MSRRSKLPAGLYWQDNGDIYVKYKGTTRRGFKTRDEAEIKLAEMRLGLDGYKESNSFKYVAEQYIKEEYEKYVQNEITYSTYIDKESIYRLHLSKITNNIRFDTLTGKSLRRIRSVIFSYDLATVTKNRILAVFKNIFNYARLYYELEKDFTIYLDNFTLTSDEKKKYRNRLEYVYDEVDFLNFIQYVRQMDRVIAFTLFFRHGLRLGEVRALLWSSYDKESLTLEINGSVTKKVEGGGWERTDTKTFDSERTIYLGETTAAMIEVYRTTREKVYGFNEDWFLLGSDIPISEKKISNERIHAFKKAGLPKITNHDMRHMFVTNAWSKAPITAISAYIGHKNVAVTLDRYSHLAEDDNMMLNAYIDKQNFLDK